MFPISESDGTILRTCSGCLEQCKTFVVERRYIDQDFRSEYTRFHSRAFASLPNSVDRVHFFAADLVDEDMLRLSRSAKRSYLGYMIFHPALAGNVHTIGRVFIAPDSRVAESIRTASQASVICFGQQLSVKGVAFLPQRKPALTCAHVGAWTCHYSAHLRGLVPRLSTGALHDLVTPGLAMGRKFPAESLSPLQLSELCTSVGLPPVVQDIATIKAQLIAPWHDARRKRLTDRDLAVDRVNSAICRSLNSGLPVLLASDYHVVTVIGYHRPKGHSTPTFVIHDGMIGPYIERDDLLEIPLELPRDGDPSKPSDPLTKRFRRRSRPEKSAAESLRAEDWLAESRWTHLISPMPRKVWLTDDQAERFGAQSFESWLEIIADASPKTAHNISDQTRNLARETLKGVTQSQYTLRTYTTPASKFKELYARRCPDRTCVAMLRAAQLPKSVWVVEMVDRNCRELGLPASVVGEVVLDATSTHGVPISLFKHVPGYCLLNLPEGAEFGADVSFVHYTSGRSGAALPVRRERIGN